MHDVQLSLVESMHLFGYYLGKNNNSLSISLLITYYKEVQQKHTNGFLSIE